MKKRCFSVLMLLLLCLALVLPAAAADAHPPRVVDDGGWFTQTEFDDLTAKLDALSEELDFDLVVVTTDYDLGDGDASYADEYFDQNNYGMNGNDGMLLLIYPTDGAPGAFISTSGKAVKIYPSNDEEVGSKFSAAIRPTLNDFDAYSASLAFADTAKELVKDYHFIPVYFYFIAIALGAILAFAIPLNHYRSQLKTVRSQAPAGDYIRKDSFKLTQQRDIFLYHTVTRTERPKDNDNSGSRTSSTGNSHGGGRV